MYGGQQKTSKSLTLSPKTVEHYKVFSRCLFTPPSYSHGNVFILKYQYKGKNLTPGLLAEVGIEIGFKKILTAHNLRNILLLDGILNLSIIIDLRGIYNYKGNLLFIDIENNNF